MSLVRIAGCCALLAGCGLIAQAFAAGPAKPVAESSGVARYVDAPVRRLGTTKTVTRLPRTSPVVTASRVLVAAEHDPTDPFAGQAELPLDRFVEEVLARHPSIASAVAAWRAAAARYPQVVSLDDPMLDTMFAPGSAFSHNVSFAYVVQGRQVVPWSGKRQLRGQVVQHETRAMSQDVADVRLRLVELAKATYYDYFRAGRQLEINAENRQALGNFRADALRRYEANLVPQQDILLADVEIADLERRQIELERMRRVAAARINTLLLRTPTAALPDPPQVVAGVEQLAPADALRQAALERRPDIAARFSRLRAEQTSVALAYREFKPDLEFVGRYDTFWQRPQQSLQGQIGMNLNVPLAQERRRAAVREASAKVAQQRAELEALVAQVQFDVQAAYERLDESRRVVLLFEQKIIPAAQASVDSARATYVAGTLDFLRLVESQRELIALRDRQVDALADYHLRLAELERVAGGPLETLSPPAEEVPPPAAAGEAGH